MADGRTPPPLLVARAGRDRAGAGETLPAGAAARRARWTSRCPSALVGGRVDLVADGAVVESKPATTRVRFDRRATRRYLSDPRLRRRRLAARGDEPRLPRTRAMSDAARWRRRSLLAVPGAFAEELVTPIRVGRSDAPIKVTVWAQQDYSHLASRPAIAAIFHEIMEDYARTHPDVQLEISAMPALEMHKAKLLLAASAGRLPDIASVDSFWMPLFLDGGHVQPLEPVLAGGGPRRLPALHHRHPLRRAGARLRHLARHRLPAALLPQGPRARAARRPGTS